MSAADPSALALFWLAVIGVAILAYVVLDGFDLGVGILFGATKDEVLRDEMIASISPFWDGNETWLIVVGATLFAAFPVVYAVFLGAFYIPVLLLLLALIFRGVAFEFRARGTAQGFWDRSFAIGRTGLSRRETNQSVPVMPAARPRWRSHLEGSRPPEAADEPERRFQIALAIGQRAPLQWRQPG